MATDRKPVVYLIAQPSVSRSKKPIDLGPLYEHGDVQVVLPQGDSPCFTPDKSFAVMEQRLDAFDPDIDFLVWAGGDTLSAVFAGMLLAERDIWSFAWLRYERARTPDGQRTDDGAKYVPIEVDLRDPQYDMELSHEGSDDEDDDIDP